MKLVRRAADAIANIHTFNREIEAMTDMLGKSRAWYAARAEASDGTWVFGPSKFIGYESNNAEKYCSSKDLDGRETEAVLKSFFVAVSPDSALGQDLAHQHRMLLADYGKVPNRAARFYVSRDDIEGDAVDQEHVRLLASAVRRLSAAEREAFEELV